MAKAKSNDKTGVASQLPAKLDITAPATRDEVPAVIEQLEARLKQLKGNHEDTISLDIRYVGAGVNTSIKDVTKVRELMEISASIQARSAAFDVEVARYGLTGKVAPFTVSEKTAADWVKIIDKAAFELINKNEITKLETTIAKLSQHLDAETKLQKELAGIVEAGTKLYE